MAKKERNTGSVGRARAKRGTSSTSESMNDPVVSSFARSRGPRWMSEVPHEFTGRNMQVSAGAAPAVEPTRPVPRPVRGGMKSSLVPVPRPYTMEERGAVERGNRAAKREAQKFGDGGMVRGCGPAQMSGKGFRGDF